MKFAVHATIAGSRARAATLETARDAVATPVFMPVGTRATVRTQTLAQLAQLDAPILLANTYHLGIRPGVEVFERFGGLHRWMGWPRSILTDSGGFQVFSLPGTVIDDAGATLRDPGGPARLLSPERSIATQRAIGSDIMMVLDHCVASTCSHAEAAAAMQRTHRWARRSLAARGDAAGALFAIVQGACFVDLRRTSADALVELGAAAGAPGFDGYAIGGLAVGETAAERQDTTELVTERLPVDRPRYLMGVGMPIDLLEGVHRGVDLFDCILPTALAQQGVAFTSRGRIDLARGVHRLAEQALDPACRCDACTRTPRSYLHHLIKCREPLGWQLLAFHNLAFYARLMADIRAHIRAGTFLAFYAAQRALLGGRDPDHPAGRRPRVKPRKPSHAGAFALHTTAGGAVRIQHRPSGELTGDGADPALEAARIFVEPSARLAPVLSDPAAPPVVVWDVGLGAGHNAMALVRAVERALDGRPGRPADVPGGEGPAIQLVSFARDLDAFRLALAHVEYFPHLRHRAPHVVAHRGRYRSEHLAWSVCEGEFLAGSLAWPPPDVIFYDPFPAAADPAMWSVAAFARLVAHLGPGVELFTRAGSVAVRAALLAAGFHVARGAAWGHTTGPAAGTTIALTAGPGAPPWPHALLGRDWLAQHDEEAATFAADLPAEQRARQALAVRGHPQFRAPVDPAGDPPT